MRIILLVVFYIATYAARIAAGDIAATISGNSVKHILRQKTRTTRSRVCEVPVDDGMTQKTIKRGKQSSLVNRIDGFLQTRRLPNGKSTRVRRNPQGRTKRARNSDGEIARHREDFDNDDDIDADDVWSDVMGSRGLPVWQVTKSPTPAINTVPTTTPKTIQLENPENSDRSVRTNEPILPLTYSNSRKTPYEVPETPTFEWQDDESQNRHKSEAAVLPRKPVYILSYPNRYVDAVDGSFAFPKTSSRYLPNSESSDVEPEDIGRARSPVSGKPIERVFVPVYRLGTLADAHSPRFLNGYQQTPSGWHSDNQQKLQIKDNVHASSFRKFLLVPLSKDLYVLKDADEDSRPRASANGDNATSAVLAFKAHLHHGAQDVGKAYLRGHLLKYQHHLRDHDANHSLPDLDPTVFREENADPAREPTSYPNFLYSGAFSQTYPSLTDTVTEMSDEEIALQAADLGLDHRNPSSVDSVVDSYDEFRLPSTSSSFDMPDYGVSSYPGNADDRRSRIFELDEIGQFGSNSGGYEESPKYNKFDIESTTVDFSKLLSTLNNDIDALITVRDAEMYITDDDKALFSQLTTTEVYLFDTSEDHITSGTLFSDDQEQWSKRRQTKVENSRTLLTAIEPLSSELQRLLGAVKLVNKSISDLQSRLCDKKNVVGPTLPVRDNEEEKAASSFDKADYYNPSFPKKNRQFRRRKRIESGNKHEGIDDTKLRKRSNGNSLFLNKLTTPLRRGDFLKKSNEKKSLNSKSFHSKSFESIVDSPHTRLNRKLKSLTRNHEARVEPIGQFVGSGLKKMTRVMISATTLSHLIKNDVSNESDFLNRHVPSFSRHSNKSILPLRENKDNPEYLSSNSKRDLKRYDTNSATSRRTYSFVDPELYTEATAYLDVLRLLNITEEPRTEYPIIVDFTTSTVTKPLSLLITATMGFVNITMSRLEEETTTVEILETGVAATTETTIEYPPATSALVTTTIAIPRVTSEIWKITPVTQIPITLRAFTVSTTSPLLYTTRSPTIVVNEIVIPTSKIVTEKTVAVLTTRIYVTEATPITEEFTTEPTMMLTPFLKGVTDITLKITIPAITETPFAMTLSLVTETVTMEGEITAITIESLPTTLETTIKATTLSTLRETVVTTSGYLTPETEESPVTQFEKTITAKEEMTTTESPMTTKAPTITESPATTENLTTNGTITTTIARTTKMPTIIETTIVRKIPTTTQTLITIRVPTITKILATTETQTTTKMPTTIGTPTTTKIPTTIKTPITTKVPTTAKIVEITILTETTITKIPTIIRTPTTIKVLTTTETLTTFETPITTESTTITIIPTTIIETATVTEAPIITETLAAIEISTTIEIPTTIKIPSTTETPTTIEVVTTTEILTAIEIPSTVKTSTTSTIPIISTTLLIIKTPTITEVLTTIGIPTTVEIPTTIEILFTTEVSTISETLSTTETPVIIEILTTTIVSTSNYLPSEAEESPVTQIEKTITAEEEMTTTESPMTTEAPTITESPATTESLTINGTTTTTIARITKMPTIIETTTVRKIPTTIQTPITIRVPTIVKILTTTETRTTTKMPITQEIPTIKKTSTTAKIPATTKIPTTIGTPTTTKITTTVKTPTTTKVPTTAEIVEITVLTQTIIPKIPTIIRTSTTIETPITTESTTITIMPTATIETTIITEIPITFETPITTESTTIIIMPTATIETPTITETPTIIEVLTTTETLTTFETLITTESTTITIMPTATIETTTITETPITFEILTTTETLTTSETLITTESTTITIMPTATIETTTITETPITFETPITTESTTITIMPTATIETTTITETPITFEVLTTTETLTTFETLIITESTTITIMPTATIETPTITEAPITIETLAATEVSTTIAIRTIEISFTTETPTTVEVVTTTEISTTAEIRTTTEILFTTEVPTTSEIPSIVETPITSEIPSIVKTPTTIEVLTTVKIVTTSEILITTESTIAKIPISTIETPISTESSTIAEILTATATSMTTETQTATKVPTLIKAITIKIRTTTEAPQTIQTSTLVETPTTVEVPTTTETSTVTEIRSTTIFTTTFSTTFDTFFTKTISPMIIITTTTSPIKRLEIITTPSVSTTISIETSPIITDTTVNATILSTTVSTITTEILENTTSPLVNFTTSFTTKIPLTTTVTTYTSTVLEEYEEYYRETDTEKGITVTTSTAEIEEEKTTISITTEETIAEVATPTYLPSPTTFFIETTTETTSLVNETVTSFFTSTVIVITPAVITSTMITKETTTLTTEEITSANFTIALEETKKILTSTEVTWISTKRSPVPEVETITPSTSSVPTTINVTEIVTTPAILLKPTTETAGTSTETTTTVTLSPTTKRPEYEEVSEIITAETLTPFIESTLTITEMPVTTAKVISTLPKTVTETEEFTTTPSTTEKSTTSFIETTVHITISTSIATTKTMPEVETEYYVDKALESQYEEEEEEEYDTEIPTDKWYYYDEYETTTKERTVQEKTVTPSTVSYTTLREKKVTSISPFVEVATTLSYETKTSEPATSPAISETATTIRADVTSTISTTSRTPRRTHVEEEISPTVALKTSTVAEKIKTLETIESTEFTTFTVSEKEETATTTATFGSTEEYTLPSSTILKITTEPLESLTIPAKYTYTEPDWLKSITKPGEIPDQEIVVKKTTFAKIGTTSERVLVEKTTLIFVSPILTTLSEEELMDVYATTVSSVVSELTDEIASYGVTTQLLKTMPVTEESIIYDIEISTATTYTYATILTTEEIFPHLVTPFTVPGIEADLTTISKIGEDVVREEQKKRLLQEFDELMRHEKEMAEREERLKEKERQWDREKKRHKEKMMQREREEAEKATTTTSTTATDIMFIVTDSTTITVIDTELSTESLTVSTASTLEITPSVLDMTFATLDLDKVTTAWTETTSFYTIEKSTSTTLAEEEIKEKYDAGYVTEATDTWLDVFYGDKLTSMEIFTPYTVEEISTTSYETFFIPPTMATTSVTDAISIAVTERKYNEEIENLKKRLREKEHDLKEREKMLLERERRLEEDMEKFKKYMEELKREETDTSTATSEESTAASEESTVTSEESTATSEESTATSEESTATSEESTATSAESTATSKESTATSEESTITSEESTATSEESTITSEESTVPTSLTTPVPPTEMSTIARVTMPVEKMTEEKETRTTAKTIVTPQWRTTKTIEEQKRTMYVSEEATTPEEEKEIVTKRICLNVLANTTIPYEKRRRNVVMKKICLPYFPEKKKVKKSVGRLSRKILAVQVAKEIKEPRENLPSGFQHRTKRRITENVRKINNLQLSHREWLNNETTKSPRHFKGFTRLYKGTRRIFPKNVAAPTDARRNGNRPRVTTFLYERHVLDRQESSSQPITTAMSAVKGYRKRSVFPGGDLIRKTENNLSDNNDEITVDDTSTNEEKRSDEDQFGFYTVNVLRLKYNEDEETHQTMPVKLDEDEMTFTVESSNEQEYDDFDRVDSGESGEIIKPYHELEEKIDVEKNDTEEENNDSGEMGKERTEEETKEEVTEEEDDYDRAKTSTSAHDVKMLVDPSERGTLIGKQKELMDQAWPTEKSTTYHLGGTRYWKLESQITETMEIFSTTIGTTTETIDLLITKTTCLYVVLKNERNHARTKREVCHHEESVRFPTTSVRQRDNFLQNVTSERTLRNEKPKTKRSIERRSVPKFDEFPNTDELSTLTKGRKLCGINENKLKHQIAKHQDIRDIRHNDKRAKSTKSHKSRDINSHASRVKEANSCIVNKKNSDQRKSMIAKVTVDHHTSVKNNNDRRNDGKLVHHDVTVAKHRNKSTRKTHDCVDCICDIVDMINHVKFILDKLSYPLDGIKALNCSRYKEIQHKIVISMASDVEEDIRVFPQPRYNTESLKGQKYIKSEDLGNDSKDDLMLENDRDIISLPGLNLNVPCNRDGDGWLSSVSRPSYTWKRTDGIALYGFVTENGDLELRNVNAKDTGNYTCVVTYTGADNEEPVETTYEVRLRVITLPRYILHGEGRYRVRFCDERGLDALVTYLPLKLNNVLCEADICNAYVLAPSCSRSQITMNVLIVPSHIVKLTTIDYKHCSVFCLKAIQDKLSLILSANLQIFLEKTNYPISSRNWCQSRKSLRSPDGKEAKAVRAYSMMDSSMISAYFPAARLDTVFAVRIVFLATWILTARTGYHAARDARLALISPITVPEFVLWNSFSAVMVSLASLGVILSICLLILWVTCCAKKKFCAKRIINVISDEDAFQQEKHAEKPLIRDVSENEDQRWNSDHRIKRKRGKFNINRKHRKQSEKRYQKTQVHEDEWGSHRVMDAPMNCLDSYRSHEDYNNHYPKQSHRKGPRLPERDFDT